MTGPSTRVARISRCSLRTGERGIALIMVILLTAFLSALGMGLLLAVFMDRLASGNMAGSVAMLYAADAAIELAARDLSQEADWDSVLSGARLSSLTDGSPDGMRDIPGGGAIDLTASTNVLNCGKATNCTTAQMNANSQERPWGANNPRWRLYAFGPMDQFTQFAQPVASYLAVWVADDGREEDGDPLADAVEEGDSGHGIVRVHAEAFGIAGSRRAIEAELVRACRGGGVGACLPGIRVQSWQELRQAIP
jgi:Tfp pilus assembly protein PilX